VILPIGSTAFRPSCLAVFRPLHANYNIAKEVSRPEGLGTGRPKGRATDKTVHHFTKTN